MNSSARPERHEPRARGCSVDQIGALDADPKGRNRPEAGIRSSSGVPARAARASDLAGNGLDIAGAAPGWEREPDSVLAARASGQTE